MLARGIDILGLLIFILGVGFLLVGWIAYGVVDSAIFFGFGAFGVIAGWIISHVASRKRCHKCAESIKRFAQICRYCGSAQPPP